MTKLVANHDTSDNIYTRDIKEMRQEYEMRTEEKEEMVDVGSLIARRKLK